MGLTGMRANRVGPRLRVWAAQSWHGAESVLALALLILLCPFLLRAGRNIALADDAYYYLLPAANFWKLGFYSFDGLTATNGFHPLWMGLVTACALPLHLAGHLGALPRVVLGLSVALALWGSGAWFGALRRCGDSGWLSGLMVITAVISCRNLFLSGLETVSVFWSLGLLAAWLVRQRASGAPLRPATLAFYSLLVLLSRLDCGLFLVLLYVPLLLHFRCRDVVLAGLLLTLMAAPYLVSNLVYHSAATPISGRVKTDWGDRYELETTGSTFGPFWEQIQSGPGKTRLREVMRTVLPRDVAPAVKTLTLSFVDMGAQQHARALALLAAIIALSFLRWFRTRRGFTASARLLAAYGWCLAIFYGGSTLYYALSYDRVWPWYGAVGVLLTAGTIPLLTAGLFTRPRFRCLYCAATLVLLIWWSVANVRQVASSAGASPQSLRAVQLDLADWIRNHTTEDAISAGWAVGEIGWYAHRSVINLEGLVGNERLLEANRNTDLLPFLAQYRVSHITSFWRPSFAPRPEELLAPTASDGAWKGGPVRYFWTMRIRPMMDCPEAFSVRYRHDAGDAQETSGYVIGLDQDVIAQYLSAREDWRTRVAACATVLPAENCVRLRAGQIEANIRRSEGYFVHGSDAVYSMVDAPVGAYVVYGRACNLGKDTETISLNFGDGASEVPVPAQPRWQHVKLIQMTPSTQADRNVFQVTRMGADVFLDQLYLVPQQDQARFEALPPDWW